MRLLWKVGRRSSPSCSAEDGRFTVTFDVALANKGSVKLAARESLIPRSEDPKKLVAYQDKYESLPYPICLLVRRIDGATNTDGSVKWFPTKTSASPSEGDLRLDLLNDYELDGKYTFWMEPKE